jgi:cytochrome c oxidase assembly protein subunit 15
VWRRERIVPAWFVVALLAIVILQGALGMLTVTRLLKPLFVSLHLLFGFTTLSMLWWLVLTLRPMPRRAFNINGAVRAGAVAAARRLALLGLIALSLQIALGGWTSSNYAAMACPDVPTCQGRWWPQADFRSGFIPLQGPTANPQFNYDGGVLDNPARVAIHLTHRVGALVASLLLLAAAIAALRLGGSAAAAGLGLLLLLALQLGIGVSMVLRGFPLWLATAHNAGAALLLLATLALNRSLWPRPAPITLTG